MTAAVQAVDIAQRSVYGQCKKGFRLNGLTDQSVWSPNAHLMMANCPYHRNRFKFLS